MCCRRRVDFSCLYRVYLVRCRCTRRGLCNFPVYIESIFRVLTYPVYREYFLCVLQADVLTFPVYIDYFLCVAGGGVNFSCP